MQNSNKKAIFYIKLLILFIVVICVGLIFNLYTDKLYDTRHFGAETDKMQHLKDMQGQKTVFVGGSSTLMGVSAEYYSEISGENAINMGLHALDIYDVYLSTIEPYIGTGDTVILAFENMAYKSNWDKYNDVGLIVAHESKEYFKTARIKYKPQYFYQQTLRSFSKAYEVLYHNILERKVHGEEKVYLRKNINEYGDIKPEYTEETDNPAPYGYATEITNEAKREINYYIRNFEEKGAKVYIVFPPLYTKKDIKSPALDDYLKRMQESFGENRVLGHPSDWMFNTDEKFWDTGYHLNSPARIEHTKYYYDLIKNAGQ